MKSFAGFLRFLVLRWHNWFRGGSLRDSLDRPLRTTRPLQIDEEAHSLYPAHINPHVIIPLVLFCGRDALKLVKWGERWPAAHGNISHFPPRAVKLADMRAESG